MLTVGEILRRKREEKGLSIQEVVDGTYIQAKFIIALECNDYSVFPAEVYTKGFLKNYAELLEINTHDLLELFKETKDTVVPSCDREYYKTATDIEPEAQKIDNIEARKIAIQEALASKDEDPEMLIRPTRVEQTPTVDVSAGQEVVDVDEPKEEPIAEDCTNIQTTEQEDVLEIAQQLDEPEQENLAEPIKFAKRADEQIPVDANQGSKNAVLNTQVADLQQESFKQKLAANRSNGSSSVKTLLAIVLLLVTAAAVYFLFIDKSNKVSENPNPKTVVSNIFKPSITDNTVIAKSLELTGQVTARCWVSVVADGQKSFEDNLQPGSSFKWSAKESLKVTIGNVSALTDLKLNGKPADLGPIRNNVVEKTFYLKDI